MPELPEVETTIRGLRTLMEGRRLKAVDVRTKKLRFPLPPKFAARLAGTRILSITRRAKYILLNLDSGETLLVHLGMSGRMTQVSAKAEPEKHDHIIFTLDNNKRIAFNDPRRFGVMDLMPITAHGTHKLLRAIGPEPLGGLTVEHMLTTLAGKKAPIKNLLLDQRVVAGLGNIYVSEALFHAGIRPTRPGGKITRTEIKKLVPAIKKVLNAALKAGGTSMRNYVQANGELGYFQDRFAVYDRENQPCPGCTCRGKKQVKKIVQGGRSSYFCPVKQS
ncbi:MAG: bifunctional DNA-formamidopyrimidine glycosylase/DNA-(apurinic or apyrimidinic site) lyase [Bdellovibrionales bacterium]